MNRKEEKHAIVSEYLSGGTTTRKLGKKYGYGHVTVYRWVMAHKKYGKGRGLKVPQNNAKEELPTSVEELQEALRLSRLKIELLEAMIDISDEQFGTNIRKKAGTSQS